jgi:hypothetical protein
MLMIYMVCIMQRASAGLIITEQARPSDAIGLSPLVSQMSKDGAADKGGKTLSPMWTVCLILIFITAYLICVSWQSNEKVHLLQKTAPVSGVIC